MESLPFFIFFSTLFIPSLHFLSFAADIITSDLPVKDGQTIISVSQSFELGFFSPGTSNYRYVGIWYKKSPGTVVWVANRNKPLTDKSGVLTIDNRGNLVLLDQTKNTIWSSNVSSIIAGPEAQLLDSGNLVVRDNGSGRNTESYRWQSFDQPFDTLLPGMKLGWDLRSGQERYLTSWRSINDPSPGDITYRLDIRGLPQLFIVVGSAKKVRSGPWNGVFFGGTPKVHNSVFEPILVRNEDEIYYTYRLVNNSVSSRLTLNQSGAVERLVMYGQKSEWATIYSVPVDTCENYRQCGDNAICRVRKSPICECLQGYRSIPEEELDIQNFYGSRKCETRLTLDCRSGEGFLKLPGVKLPDLLEFRLVESMNLKECQAECFKNCSCSAFANSNISGGGSGCLMWFGNLIDIREQSGSTIGQDIHIRVPASELESARSSKRKKMLRTALVASMSTLIGIFVSGLILCICWRKIKKKVGMDRWKEDMDAPLFDLDTIATATNNFAPTSIIGAGGFGSVYKGILLTGQEIAVKKLSMNSGQGVEEFRNEVVLIAKLQHRNLVGLLGSCIHREERMLIYEYMPNKSLDYFIFDQERSALLGWKERFDIILGIARGLLYLHQDSKLQIVHRDLKPSNVLLDSNLIPKISDFGLARISGDDGKETRTRRVIGTYGYMAPEYAIDGKFSVKSDVFSLGVLLLEITSGKKNRGFVHPDHHHNLLGHAWLLWNEGRASELIDAGLEYSSEKSQLLRCIQVGLLCVQKLPEDRPVMATVVFMLANEEAALPQPQQPGFFIERGSIIDSKPRNEESCSTNEATITILEAR